MTEVVSVMNSSNGLPALSPPVLGACAQAERGIEADIAAIARTALKHFGSLLFEFDRNRFFEMYLYVISEICASLFVSAMGCLCGCSFCRRLDLNLITLKVKSNCDDLVWLHPGRQRSEIASHFYCREAGLFEQA